MLLVQSGDDGAVRVNGAVTVVEPPSMVNDAASPDRPEIVTVKNGPLVAPVPVPPPPLASPPPHAAVEPSTKHQRPPTPYDVLSSSSPFRLQLSGQILGLSSLRAAACGALMRRSRITLHGHLSRWRASLTCQPRFRGRPNRLGAPTRCVQVAQPARVVLMPYGATCRLSAQPMRGRNDYASASATCLPDVTVVGGMETRSRGDARGVRMHELEDELVVVSAPLPRQGAALTPAELEVAKLLARGRSNQEIARARRTSLRTVANQVAAVLKKLGAGSRVSVAAWLAGRS